MLCSPGRRVTSPSPGHCYGSGNEHLHFTGLCASQSPIPFPLNGIWSPFFLPTPTLSGTLPGLDHVKSSCIPPIFQVLRSSSRYDPENPSHLFLPTGWLGPLHPCQPQEVRAPRVGPPAMGNPPPAAPGSSGLRSTGVSTTQATGRTSPVPSHAAPTVLSLPGLPSCHTALGLPQPQIPGRLQWGTGGGPRVTMGLQGVNEPLPQHLHVSTSHCK